MNLEQKSRHFVVELIYALCTFVHGNVLLDSRYASSKLIIDTKRIANNIHLSLIRN